MFTWCNVKLINRLLRQAQKYLRYKRDVLDTETYDAVGADIRRLNAALHQRDRKQIEGRAEELDAKLHQLTPVTWESHWRENFQEILLLHFFAVGIGCFFFEPFKNCRGPMLQPLTLRHLLPLTSPHPHILHSA